MSLVISHTDITRSTGIILCIMKFHESITNHGARYARCNVVYQIK